MNKILKRLGLIAIAILCSWVIGFYIFISYARSFTLEYSTVTDAIVVYTGGKDRIKIGADLLLAGYAPILFISGVESPKEVNRILKKMGVKKEQTSLGLEATSTKDNAKEIDSFVISNDLKSVRLVTSFYHMPRALVETRRYLNESIIIIPHPVISDSTNYKILFKEYNKFLYAKTFSD